LAAVAEGLLDCAADAVRVIKRTLNDPDCDRATQLRAAALVLNAIGLQRVLDTSEETTTTEITHAVLASGQPISEAILKGMSPEEIDALRAVEKRHAALQAAAAAGPKPPTGIDVFRAGDGNQ
jgi:hypothetical protein